MKRHFEKSHSTLVGKTSLEARFCKLKGMQKFMLSTTILNKQLQKITYLISKRLALAGEAIAENFMKPSMLEAAEILLSKNDYQKLESISLSKNTTVSCPINQSFSNFFVLLSHFKPAGHLGLF